MKHWLIFLVLGCCLAMWSNSCSAPSELVEPDPSLARMIDQPRGQPYHPDPINNRQSIMREPPSGTVARHALPSDSRSTGFDQSGYLTHAPMAINRAVLLRGQERFTIICATCHGVLGDGNSQVAVHMRLVRPQNLHQPHIRAYAIGRLFDIISNGYGLMASHADLLSIDDRWAVAAYVQALQLSQHAQLEALPERQRQQAMRALP